MLTATSSKLGCYQIGDLQLCMLYICVSPERPEQDDPQKRRKMHESSKTMTIRSGSWSQVEAMLFFSEISPQMPNGLVIVVSGQKCIL